VVLLHSQKRRQHGLKQTVKLSVCTKQIYMVISKKMSVKFTTFTKIYTE